MSRRNGIRLGAGNYQVLLKFLLYTCGIIFGKSLVPHFCAHALSLQWGEYIDSCLHRGVGSCVAFIACARRKALCCSSDNSHVWKGDVKEQLPIAYLLYTELKVVFAESFAQRDISTLYHN